MTTYDTMKKILEGRKGQIVTATEIKKELILKFGINPGSIIPSDYCYNRINDGIEFRRDNRLFRYLGYNQYEYLGEGYPYSGYIYHKPVKSKKEIIVGEWINGELKYPQ